MEKFKTAYSNGDLKESEQLLLDALEEAEIQKERGPLVESTLTNLAKVYRDMGDYYKAEELYRKVLPYWENAFEPGHNLRLSILIDLGAICHSQRRFEEAEQLLLRAQKEANNNDEAIVTKAKIETHLGELWGELGLFERAEYSFKQALKIYSELNLEKEAAIVVADLMVLHQQKKGKGVRL